MTTSVNLIGTGRVGRTLLRLLAGQEGILLGQIASRRVEDAQRTVAEIGAGMACDISEMEAADIWILTVPDTSIAEVARDIARRGTAPAVAVHCSGYHGADVMATLRAKGWSLASAHPMLSFADPEVSAARFPGTWVGVEGDAAAVQVVAGLFEGLGARTFPIQSDAKALYHAAAVVTNNFTTVLQGIALEAWEAAGVPDDVARSLNASLLKSTLENIEALGPAGALTGPAARGDADVVNAQGQRVAEWHPEAGELYRLLSRLAVRLKTSGTTRSDRPEDSPP